jgi:hypothetical protein
MISLTFAKSPRSGQKHRQLDDVVELAAGSLRDSAKIAEHAVLSAPRCRRRGCR